MKHDTFTLRQGEADFTSGLAKCSAVHLRVLSDVNDIN